MEEVQKEKEFNNQRKLELKKAIDELIVEQYGMSHSQDKRSNRSTPVESKGNHVIYSR